MISTDRHLALSNLTENSVNIRGNHIYLFNWNKAIVKFIHKKNRVIEWDNRMDQPIITKPVARIQNTGVLEPNKCTC